MRIRHAVDALKRGGVIAYPTEACFGLGCDPFSRDAVYRILSLKRRSVEQGLILIAAKLEQLAPFIDTTDTALLEQPVASWPGPNTWILPARPGTPEWITGKHPGIAVRVSDHPLVLKLCNQYAGAIVSTSANPHGLPPARTAPQVEAYFPHRLDYVLYGATGGRENPSQIRDAATGATLRSS